MKRERAELYPGQRGKEKRELFKRFRLRAIEDVFKGRFFALFDYCCFKCGAKERPHKIIGHPPILCIDHHVPMALGGHLEPGNLVALCRRCNEAKLDKAPEQFYSSAELEMLRPLLDQQRVIFEFAFDWNAWNTWNADRGKYLRTLGVEAGLVHELLHDPTHPDFIGTQSNTIGVSIFVDDAGNLRVR